MYGSAASISGLSEGRPNTDVTDPIAVLRTKRETKLLERRRPWWFSKLFFFASFFVKTAAVILPLCNLSLHLLIITVARELNTQSREQSG
jgi:hypothetical protein